jgi:hypothetical protein
VAQSAYLPSAAGPEASITVRGRSWTAGVNLQFYAAPTGAPSDLTSACGSSNSVDIDAEVTMMSKNPILGVVFGALAIAFAVFSMVTRDETPPEGYALIDYGLIAVGAIAIIGSLVAYARKG